MRSSWILDISNDPSVFPEETYLEYRKTKVKDVTPVVLIFKAGRKGLSLGVNRKNEGEASIGKVTVHINFEISV